jgi:hypothetical protein
VKYIINSPKVGTVGDEFEPAQGINIEALIAGGFIVEESTDKPKKSSTIKKEPKE